MFKQRTGFRYRSRRRRPLWQAGYYEHIVRDEALMPPITAYILNNPLRAGLASNVSDYPFMGSTRYTIGELIDAVQWRPPSGSERRQP